jgi:hypothetical protein
MHLQGMVAHGHRGSGGPSSRQVTQSLLYLSEAGDGLSSVLKISVNFQ